MSDGHLDRFGRFCPWCGRHVLAVGGIGIIVVMIINALSHNAHKLNVQVGDNATIIENGEGRVENSQTQSTASKTVQGEKVPETRDRSVTHVPVAASPGAADHILGATLLNELLAAVEGARKCATNIEEGERASAANLRANDADGARIFQRAISIDQDRLITCRNELVLKVHAYTALPMEVRMSAEAGIDRRRMGDLVWLQEHIGQLSDSATAEPTLASYIRR